MDREHPRDFALGRYAPDIACAQTGEGERWQIRFWDTAGTSVALVDHGRGWGPKAVRGWGERRSWAEVATAYTP